MRNILIFLVLILVSFHSYGGAGVFPQGDHIKMIRDQIEFKSGNDMTSTATGIQIISGAFIDETSTNTTFSEYSDNKIATQKAIVDYVTATASPRVNPSTDEGIVRFDGEEGDVQDSGVLISDDDRITAVGLTITDTATINRAETGTIVNSAKIATLDFEATGTATTQDLTVNDTAIINYAETGTIDNSTKITTVDLEATGTATLNNVEIEGLTAENMVITDTATINYANTGTIDNATKITSVDLEVTDTATIAAIDSVDIVNTSTIETQDLRYNGDFFTSLVGDQLLKVDTATGSLVEVPVTITATNAISGLEALYTEVEVVTPLLRADTVQTTTSIIEDDLIVSSLEQDRLLRAGTGSVIESTDISVLGDSTLSTSEAGQDLILDSNGGNVRVDEDLEITESLYSGKYIDSTTSGTSAVLSGFDSKVLEVTSSTLNSIGGIIPTKSATQEITLYNSIGSDLPIENLSATVTASNRIRNPSEKEFILTDGSMLDLTYDPGDGVWNIKDSTIPDEKPLGIVVSKAFETTSSINSLEAATSTVGYGVDDGAFTGALVRATAPSEVLDGESSIDYSDLTANGNWFEFANLELKRGYKGRWIKLSFLYETNADGLEFSVVDENLDEVYTASIPNSGGEAKEFEDLVFIPADDNSLSMGIYDRAYPSGTNAYFDNFEASFDLNVTAANIKDIQEYNLEQPANALTNLSAELEFNLATATIDDSGTKIVEAVDDSANTRTQFIARRKCTVTIRSSAQVSANESLGIGVNGVILAPGSTTGSGAAISTIAIKLDLDVGDYVTIGNTDTSWRINGFNGSINSVAAPVNVHFVAEALSDHVVTPARSSETKEKILSSDVTSSGDIADFTFTGLEIGKTYFLSGYVEARDSSGNPKLIAYSGASASGTNYGAIFYTENATTTGGDNQGSGVSLIFTAQSDTLYVYGSNIVSSAIVRGNGTKSESFLQLTNVNAQFLAAIPKNVYGEKILASDISTGDESSLQFSNLTVGNYYQYYYQVFSVDSNDPPARVQFRDASGGLGAIYGYSNYSNSGTEAGSATISGSFIFKASTSNIYFHVSSAAATGVKGDGTKLETFVQLEERRDLEKTTRFD